MNQSKWHSSDKVPISWFSPSICYWVWVLKQYQFHRGNWQISHSPTCTHASKNTDYDSRDVCILQSQADLLRSIRIEIGLSNGKLLMFWPNLIDELTCVEWCLSRMTKTWRMNMWRYVCWGTSGSETGWGRDVLTKRVDVLTVICRFVDIDVAHGSYVWLDDVLRLWSCFCDKYFRRLDRTLRKNIEESYRWSSR